MYKCDDCKCKFYEPKIEKTTYETYLGVSDLFSNHTELEVKRCPHCDSESVERIEE